MDEIYCDHLRKCVFVLGSGRRGDTDSSVVNLPTQQIAASLAPNVDYANFSGKFALAANRGQITG
jgi:hypothetical protein